MNTHRTAVRDWLDTLGQADLAAAQQVQRAIDASYTAAGSIPTGQARELDLADLMPLERAFFGRAWADTEPAGAA